MVGLYSASMSETIDPRTPVAIATAGLPGDPRRILERIATAGVQAVQLSTDRRGIRPDDLDRSGRQDLRVAVRRRELRLAGLDHGFDPVELLSPERVDSAAMLLLDAIRLAGDLGPVPIAVRFPGEGAEEVIATALETADRLGVTVVDFGVPPRGTPVRDRAVGRPTGLIIPGQTDETPTLHEAQGDRIEGLAIGVDPPSWLAAGLDFEAVVGEGVGGVRLAGLTSEGWRVPAGASGSRVDPGLLVAMARSSGFEGDPVIDARGWAEPWQGIELTRASLAVKD